MLVLLARSWGIAVLYSVPVYLPTRYNICRAYPALLERHDIWLILFEVVCAAIDPTFVTSRGLFLLCVSKQRIATTWTTSACISKSSYLENI